MQMAEQTAPLIVCRRILGKLVKDFDYVKQSLHENSLKEFKGILKNNPDVIAPLYKDFMKYLRQNDCEHRLAILFLCRELFKRSHIFRVEVTNTIEDFLLYTAETDPLHYPFPAFDVTAGVLKLETLKLLKTWHDKYAEAYPKLGFIVQYLRSSKAFDFEHIDAQLQVERRRNEEAERKKDEKSKCVVEKLSAELREHQPDILHCVDETRRAIELLVPRFEVDDDAADVQSSSGDQAVHAYTGLESVTVTLSLKAPVVVVNDENRVIVNSLVDCMKMLNFYEKLVHRWLSKLAKYGGRNAQNLCKEIIDLKGKIALELERCNDLKLPNKMKTTEEDSDSDDLEDVPEKEGLELNFKPPEKLPDYIIRKTLEKDEGDVPGPSKRNLAETSNFTSGHEKQEDDGNKVPILAYGLDLKYWGKDDIEPAEVPRNNADCHRFWRPSDEGCSTSRDTAEAYHSRVITFVGQELRGSRQCRAPLKDGTLCPRMDLKRCPLHGKIILRDEMGYPVEEIKQKPVDAKIDAKEEEEYIRDVEAATGIKLEGKTRGGKRKRHNGDSSNEPIAVRERLNTKLFNRTTMKRVYETLENIQKARAAKNFEHQFNYALSRK